MPRVHWQDIGGQHDTKQRLLEAVEWPLKVNHVLFYLFQMIKKNNIFSFI